MTDATEASVPGTTPATGAAQRTAAGQGEAYWFFDSLMVIRSAVMLQVHADDSFLRFIQAVGHPASSRPGPPEVDLNVAFAVAAQTGQPVIGPPMTEAEAQAITAGAAG